jgi:hypothetical protein
VKLLLDQNLSHKLVARLEPKYPGTKRIHALETSGERMLRLK